MSSKEGRHSDKQSQKRKHTNYKRKVESQLPSLLPTLVLKVTADDEDRKNKRSKRVEVAWSLSGNTEGDFEALIKGYNEMTSVERLKAKTRYLEQRCGAVTSLEKKSTFDERVKELADEEDMLGEAIKNVPKGEYWREILHEDAMFGVKNIDLETKNVEENSKDDWVVTDQVMQSQKSTSWRERAAWRRKQRATL